MRWPLPRVRAATAPATATPLVLLLAPGALVGTAFGLVKVVRDCSLTCNVGFRWAPLGLAAISLLVLPASALRLRWEHRLGAARWAGRSATGAGAVFVAFWAVTGTLLTARDAQPGNPAWGELLRAVYLLLFVWVGVSGAVLGANLKRLWYAEAARDPRGALLPLGAAAVVSGGLLGSALAGLVEAWLSARLPWSYERVRDALLVLVGLALLAWVPLTRALGRRGAGAPPVDAEAMTWRAVMPMRLGETTALVARTPGLRAMAAVFTASGVAEAALTYLFYWVVTEETSGASGRASLFAEIYAWLHGATLAFMVFGTRRVLDRVGLLAALATLPLSLALGTAWLALHGGLLAVVALRIAEKVVGDALYEPALDRWLLGLEGTAAPELRPFFQTVALVGGRGLGALAVFALGSGLHLTYGAFLGVCLAWSATWLVAIVLATRCRTGRTAAPG